MPRSQRDVYDALMQVDAADVQEAAIDAAAAPATRRERWMPVACGCVLAGAAAVVALNDPAAPGSRFPACQFHAVTGLWCPGCGLTRGFHQLLTGHPLAALSYNVFVPIVLVAVVGSWWGWTRASWGRSERIWPSWVRQRAGLVMTVAMVAYAVLRNIPAAPFDALAP